MGAQEPFSLAALPPAKTNAARGHWQVGGVPDMVLPAGHGGISPIGPGCAAGPPIIGPMPFPCSIICPGIVVVVPGGCCWPPTAGGVVGAGVVVA